MKNCKKYQVLIYKKIDGLISDSQNKKLEEHMKICPSCQKEYEFSKRIIDSLCDENEVLLPLNFKEELHKKLVAENLKHEEKKSFFGKFPLGITATACVTAFLMIFTLSQNIDKNYNNLSKNISNKSQYETTESVQNEITKNSNEKKGNNLSDIKTNNDVAINNRRIVPSSDSEEKQNDIIIQDASSPVENTTKTQQDNSCDISACSIENETMNSNISSQQAIEIATSTLTEKSKETINIDNPEVQEIIFYEKPSIFLYDENYDVTGRTLYKITFNSSNEILGPLVTYVDKETGKFIGHNMRN